MGRRPKSPFPDFDEEQDMIKIWDYQPNQKFMHNVQQLPQYAPAPVPVSRAGNLQRGPLYAATPGPGVEKGYLLVHPQAMVDVIPQPPVMIGGRRWWEALGKLISVVATLMAIAVEFLFVMRDATANVTSLGSNSNSTNSATDDSASDEGGDTTGSTKRLLIRAAANATSKGASTKHASNTTTNSTACQWVTNTDVQNNGNGIPYAVSYHLFTAVVLMTVLLAELHLLRHRLHPSAKFQVAIVQLWAGLAILSRAFDVFSQIVGYTLLVAGIGNFAFGFMARFEPGGPGFSLFQTAKAATPEQVAQHQQQQALAAAQAQQAQVHQKGDLAAPSPYDEEKQAVQQQQQQQNVQAASQQQAPTGAVETSITTQQPATGLPSQIVLPNPMAPDSGYDTMPLLNQLGMTNPFLQQHVLQALSTPGGVNYANTNNPLLMDESAPMPPPAHLLQSSYVTGGGSGGKKKWRHRMSATQSQ